jgi:putative hydrolase of the HAD superfamily
MSAKPSRSPGLRARAVFFDLAGTLVTVRGGIGAQYSTIARQYGVEADASAIDAAFPRALAAAGRMAFPAADAAEVAALERRFWKNLVRLVFAEVGGLPRFEPGQFDRYFDHLFDYFATAAGWSVYPDVVPAIDGLKRQGFIVGVITNFDSRVFALVDAVGLAPLLDSITVPALAGAAKPDAAIFDYALARHGLRASDAVQIGDSRDDDIDGARAAGMQAVLVDRKGRFEEVAGETARVRTLDELPAILRLRR